MSSRKYFLSITAMMLVLIFMFMFSEIRSSSNHNYSDNSHAKVTPIVHKENERDADAVKVWFYGDNSSLRNAVSAWCRYTKKNYVEDGAAIIVVDSKSLDNDKVSELEDKANSGAILIFAGFPDMSLLEKNSSLKNLMGITKILSSSQKLEGIHLTDGFLLGGEKTYDLSDDDKKEIWGLTNTVPYFVTGKGVKAYMTGILSEADKKAFQEKENNKSLVAPALIWRAVTDKTVAFVIADDYTDETAIQGVLEACAYEASDFTLCPVVNASVYTVADFAFLSEENAEKIQEIYSRSTQSLVKEIIWPRLMSYAKRENIILTCYFNTQLEKETRIHMQTNFTFFLREMRDIGAETGISGNTINDNLKDKLAKDLTFYLGTGNNYEFTSIYLADLKAGDIEAMSKVDNSLYSMVLKNKGECDYVDATDNLLINAVTSDASAYTYKADFAYRSLQTAIGYSNVLIDIKRVLRPETKADQWQNYSKLISGNLADYWVKMSSFENVSASDAAMRTAAYMKNTALCTRKGRSITISGAEPGYFLLRTHGEAISNIKNASFTFIEKGVYLITVTNNEAVEITVE